jgi:hypothetical protein
MKRGYVCLWRKMMDNGMMRNSHLLHVWIWCLMKASHKAHKMMVGFVEVDLLPGQFVFGRKAAALDTGLGEQTIRTCLNSLKSTSNITIKVTNKFSILTICNWATYQSSISQSNQQINQQINQPLTSNQPASNQQLTTNNNGNNADNVKNGEKKIKRECVRFIEPSPEEVTEYSASIGHPMDGQAWCDSYAVKGWKVGKNVMKDWKAAVRTWKNNGWNPVSKIVREQSEPACPKCQWPKSKCTCSEEPNNYE